MVWTTSNEPQYFEISQQSRDTVAILRAAGETSAFVFGNSSGAVIALDMAKTQSQAVRAVVAHEPPLARLHPHAKKWQRFFAGVYWTAFRFGTLIATLGVGFPLRPMAKIQKELEAYMKDHGTVQPTDDGGEFLLKQELLPVTNYLPDVEMIKKNGVKVFMATGKISLDKKRFYAQTVPLLAEKLGCEIVTFPGHHHYSFADMPNEWTAALRCLTQSGRSKPMK